MQAEQGRLGSFAEVALVGMNWIVTFSEQHELVKHHFLMTFLFLDYKDYYIRNTIEKYSTQIKKEKEKH